MIKIEKWIEDWITEKEFMVELTGEVTNDGIGSYEFWGQVCFHRGTDYVDDISFDSNGLTPEQEQQVNAMIAAGEFDSDFNDSMQSAREYKRGF